jgi:hypothetical protein
VVFLFAIFDMFIYRRKNHRLLPKSLNTLKMVFVPSGSKRRRKRYNAFYNFGA